MELVVLVLVAAVVVLPIWAAVDAARRPAEQFLAIGSSQTLWIVLPLVGLVLSPLGLVVALVYLAGVRPRMRPATV